MALSFLLSSLELCSFLHDSVEHLIRWVDNNNFKHLASLQIVSKSIGQCEEVHYGIEVKISCYIRLYNIKHFSLKAFIWFDAFCSHRHLYNEPYKRIFDLSVS